MFQKVSSRILLTAMTCFVLVFASSAPTWALTILQQNVYSGSKVVNKGGGAGLKIVQIKDDGVNQVQCSIESGALDAYMTEKGITQVTIACELTEELVLRDDGVLYYRLSFHFSPHGAYFTPNPLLLKIKGTKYVSPNTDVWLYDEAGEAVEGTRYNSADMIKFEIPHFSHYYYDGYY